MNDRVRTPAISGRHHRGGPSPWCANGDALIGPGSLRHVATLLLAVALVGCSDLIGPGPEPMEVIGHAYLDGDPLEGASIRVVRRITVRVPDGSIDGFGDQVQDEPVGSVVETSADGSYRLYADSNPDCRRSAYVRLVWGERSAKAGRRRRGPRSRGAAHTPRVASIRA